MNTNGNGKIIKGGTLPAVGLTGLTRESVWLVSGLLGAENKHIDMRR